MKKILYVSPVDMFSRTGGGLATLAIYNALKQIYPQNIDLFHAEDYIPEKYKHETNFIYSKRITYLRWLLNILLGHYHRFYPSLFNYIKKNENNYDLCIVNGSRYIGDIINRFKKSHIKFIVIHHNFELEYVKANKNISTLWGLLNFNIVKQEKLAYLKSHANLFLTSSDYELFKKSYGPSKAICKIISVFEPENINIYNKSIHKNCCNLVISGALNFSQSITGIINYFSKYYSLNCQIKPFPKIIITGRNPNENIYSYCSIYNIDLYPNPENIIDIIDKGNIYLCPINVGGGIKLRIMDGLKIGMPVITHICSARGYEPFFNKPYFKIYNNSESYIKGLSELVLYVNSNDYNPKNIIKDYLEYFSFNAGVNRLREIIQLVLLDVN